MKRLLVSLFLIAIAGCVHQTHEAMTAPAATSVPEGNDLATSPIHWQDWSQAAFDQAKHDNRLIILHLGAGWCHWCHVMEHITYRDPAVVKLLQDHFVAIHVDQDSRPDLSNRYEDYGWPATILFDSTGHELVKLQGYIPPARMRSILEATIADPTPGPSVTNAPNAITPNSNTTTIDTATLQQRLTDRYDPIQKGWGTVHKYLDADALEYEITRARVDDTLAKQRAIETLAATRKLIDPVWGGIYQYSTDGDWDHPHFEKIMSYQADALRIYSLAYANFHDPADLASAQSIHHYLTTFLLSKENAFFTSQDADLIPGQHSADYFALSDTARRKLGIPRIDQHLYTRENGWAIRALVSLYKATGDEAALIEARSAAAWIQTHRSLADGGYLHDEHDAFGPFLGDSLSMAQANLALFEATTDRTYLDAARQSTLFINTHFQNPIAGYFTVALLPAQSAILQLDENASLARLTNLLYHYTGDDHFKTMANHITPYLAAEAQTRRPPATTLLAAEELSNDPAHVAIVTPTSDPIANTLYQTALRSGLPYLRIEMINLAQSPSLRKDITYPPSKKAAAFFCTSNACSAPVYTPEKLRALIDKRTRKSPE